MMLSAAYTSNVSLPSSSLLDPVYHAASLCLGKPSLKDPRLKDGNRQTVLVRHGRAMEGRDRVQIAQASLEQSERADRDRKVETVAFTLYLLVTSGAFFPLRFIPVNYEWIALAATMALFAFQIHRHGFSVSGSRLVYLGILLFCVVLQAIKFAVTSDSVDILQFLRGLYGLGIFFLGMTIVTTGSLDANDLLVIANRVLVVLFVLIIASLATGFQFYVTGFIPEAGQMDVQDQVASGNFRIISYYSAFVVFLLFQALVSYLRRGGRSSLIHTLVAVTLVVLTGARSVIAPSLFVSALLFLRYAKISKSLLLLAIASIAAMSIYIVVPGLVDAYLSRFAVEQIFDDWRALEQTLALTAIPDHPIFGLPLGVPYTHVMSALAGGTEGYSVNADYDLHNEYLWFMLYYGVVGSAALALLVGTSIVSTYRTATDGMLRLAYYCYLIVMFAAMSYSSVLLKGYGALWYGIALGITSRPVGAALRKRATIHPTSPQPPSRHPAIATASARST